MHYDSCPLGHDKLETTAGYTRVATGMISAVEQITGRGEVLVPIQARPPRPPRLPLIPPPFE